MCSSFCVYVGSKSLLPLSPCSEKRVSDMDGSKWWMKHMHCGDGIGITTQTSLWKTRSGYKVWAPLKLAPLKLHHPVKMNYRLTVLQHKITLVKQEKGKKKETTNYLYIHTINLEYCTSVSLIFVVKFDWETSSSLKVYFFRVWKVCNKFNLVYVYCIQNKFLKDCWSLLIIYIILPVGLFYFFLQKASLKRTN